MPAFGRIGRAPSEYLAEMQEAAATCPRVCLVLVQPGTSRLVLLEGSDPTLADQLTTLLEGRAFPLAVAAFGADDVVHLRAVEEYRTGQPWVGRFLVLLGERLRAQLERAGPKE